MFKLLRDYVLCLIFIVGRGIMWLIIIIILIVSLISIISPKNSWYMSNWWRFQENAEPSDFSLKLYRIIGILSLFVLLLWVYINFF
jgi:uncharacterized protein DUF6199